MTSRAALIALLTGAAAIAFAPIFVRWSEVGPSATAFWRIALALPVLALWMSAERRSSAAAATTRAAPAALTASDRRRLLLAGLFFAGDLAVWHWSIRFTSVANATLLANFTPVSQPMPRSLIAERGLHHEAAALEPYESLWITA